MSYFVLTCNQYDGDKTIKAIYQADLEQDVWNYLHETELEFTNDPVKAEKDREDYFRNHNLIELPLITIS